MRRLLFLGAMLLMVFQLAVAQTVEVTGRVVDDKGNPIPGVSVTERSTKKGTSTDANGNFKISVQQGAVLNFTSIGFDSKSVTASGSILNVVLGTSNTALSEVVVTGTGVGTTKKKLAIAVESVTADKLPQTVNADVGSALVGKIAGAQISSVNGSPGAPVNILLRGINSINGGTRPMILVDGVEVNATGLESLDLSAYERIEVVQGPAAASIYGAQGANGVIQLFTKKGRSGKVNIDFNSSVAVNQLLNIGGVQKAKKHAFRVNANGEVVAGNGTPLSWDEETGSYLTNPVFNLINKDSKYENFYNKNLLWYDHYDMFFVDGTTYNNSLSINGSKDRFDFNIIASDNRQKTVFKDNGDFSRTNLTVNLGAELAKGLRLRTTTQLIYTNSTLLDPDGRNMFYAINNARPFADFTRKDAAGFYSPYYGDAVGVNHYNFNYIRENADVRDQTIDIVQSFNLNYKLPKFVELDAKYGINRSELNSRYQIYDQQHSVGAEFYGYQAEYYSPRVSYHDPAYANAASGEINQGQYITTFQNLNTSATIRFNFEDDFKMNFPLMSTTQVGWDYRKRDYNQYITYGGDAPDFTPYRATNMGVYKTVSDFVQEFATYGYYVNQRFDWSDWAGASVGFRSDYSSAFGRGSKPQTFPRGDAYVRLSGLNFWSNSKLANTWTDFKIRAAYGEAGIQPGAYDRFPVLSTGVMGTQSYLSTPVSNANPDLRVEVAKELEIGADFGFRLGKGDWFRNLNLAVTYWTRRSEDVIDRVDVAPSTGAGRILTNSMELKSDGIQASLNLGVYNTKDLNWNFTALFSKQNSIVDKILGDAEIIKTSNAGSTQYVIKAGEQIGQIYGFLFLNDVNALKPDGTPWIPKDQQANYEVASNGYVVDKARRVPYVTPTTMPLGDPNPKFNMSFINDFNFKGYLTFGIQFDWVYKSYLYNQTKQWMYRDGIHKDYDNEITIDGQTAAWSAFYRGAYAERRANGTKSYFMEDATFLRLRNLNIGFDFAKFFKMKSFTRLQLVLTGRNLWTKTNYTGMDPEVSSGSINSSWDRAVDHNTIPNLKTYQVGLNVGF
ncbi:SusC/RagA family TonB-linked outer membrane protein [Flavihumibacter rivuli]|uniref:SusC/RagA family TonB-linked outer membrane protein n=1 Tax=Flavihumibacter rivuli TaxID=2838156 RepID=UPI001BDDD8AD|nr:SusC/RagA family TonB-linked outer membrane protein [Flavihumibacter rivuli]ULQ55155.1 SusC/RagA family TonB-linked outer membrane protein [Flavihumibacter rivuli]